MNELTNEQIYQEISKIVSQFDLFECYECAKEAIKWLKENRIKGKLLEIKTKYRDEDYIISDRFNDYQSITTNGKHYGVEVRGKVFDNLSPQGMTKETWLQDFHCQSEEFLLNELEIYSDEFN